MTDRRILVGESGKLTATKINRIAAEGSRATRIGPASGLWFKCEALGAPMYVNKRFHQDIALADSFLGDAPA